MSDVKSAAAQPVQFRGGGFTPGRRRWVPWITFVLIIGGWQLASSTHLLPPLFMPSPVEVALAMKQLWLSGKLWFHISASLQRIAVGWALGTSFGLILGFAMGIFSIARSAGIPVVSALFPIPKIALLPLLIIWFGIGEPAKYATIGLGVLFPTIISTYSAVDNVPRNLIRMGQSFNLSPRAIVLSIILPGAMPGILAGFRITSSIALILMVAAEMIGADYGIGAFVLSAGNLMQSDQLIAGVVMLSLMGLAISLVLSRLEKWLLRWR